MTQSNDCKGKFGCAALIASVFGGGVFFIYAFIFQPLYYVQDKLNNGVSWFWRDNIKELTQLEILQQEYSRILEELNARIEAVRNSHESEKKALPTVKRSIDKIS